MKNLFYVFLVSFIFITNSKAQSYFGFQNDNYAGVNGVVYNPSSIVDSRFRSDINLASYDVGFSNNYYSFNFGNIFGTIDDGNEFEILSQNKSNSFFTKFDVLGPSFMMNIDDIQSIALTTRFRGISHFTDLDGRFLNSIANTDANENYSISNQNFSIASNTWFEVGGTYARVLLNKDENFLKGGLTLKYIVGINSAYIKANNFSVQYDNNASTYTTTGNIEVGNTNGIGAIDSPFDNSGKGYGADIGITYEYRPNNANSNLKSKNKYLYRVAFSITDLGVINTRNAPVDIYNANGTISESNFENGNFDSFYTLISTKNNIRTSLPTAIHTNFDWNFNKNLFLNINTELSLVKNINVNSNYISNNMSITPRFESRWFSAYLPISYLKYSGIQAGFGFRAGPLFIGSGSILNLMVGESKSLDLNFGLKIPIYYGSKK